MKRIGEFKGIKPVLDHLMSLLTHDLSTKRQLTIEISDTEVRGLIISIKLGIITVEDAFCIQEKDVLNSTKTALSEQVVVTIRDKVKEHKTSRTGISIALSISGGVDKIVKLPPLDNKTMRDMLNENYKKFFTTLTDDNIQGTETLGNRGKKQGEVYFLLSTFPKLPTISLSNQLEKRKVRINNIYNEVLALRNVLSLVTPEKQTKCLLFMWKNRVQLVVTHNNTLIFHKMSELNRGTGGLDDLNIGYSDAWSNSKIEGEERAQSVRISSLNSTLSWAASTLEYINQKKNVIVTEVLIAGDYLKIPTAKELISEELGVYVQELTVSHEENTAMEIVNWTNENLESDYLISLGLSLRGLSI